MLQIDNICKTYRTGGLTQRALDHVSLSLRDSEFVAILGQSGSGKTTLLNIIGGLDRYDEGDLIIGGVSTKRYSDRDWDSYRNHTVGFVFQSYNLIPHQTILANVELALTISGISRKERTRRAREALEKVGLGQHIHKRPAQLSGGQMQRVAIARALVNDPDILLADEPTGALDSDTSIQVMELLKEVAADRLVVMVTHNPELAEAYATRIVNLRDGVILSDSDPFVPPPVAEPPRHKNMGKASMSFLTALMLSFNNLRTKKARTILVAIAGSIGIIGIAMILSLSNGVDKYIQGVQEETLQGYPLQITDTSMDLMSMYVPDEEEEEEPEEKEVREWKTITRMFSRITTNDLKSLKAFFDGGGSGIEKDTRAIEYTYNISPQIYTLRSGKVRQVNPDNSFAALGFTSGESMNSLLSAFSSTDTFHPMPEDEDLYLGSYDVKAGHWPENYHECVLVLTGGGRVTDMTLYVLGLKDPMRLDEMVKAFAKGATPETDLTESRYNYDEFLGISFRLVDSSDYYVYDRDYKVWTDKTADTAYMKNLVEDGEVLTIVGVVQPREDATGPILSQGIDYPWSLTEHVMAQAADAAIVREQLSNRDVNVFTGKRFDDESREAGLDMATLFSVDEDALEKAFSFDEAEWDFSDLEFEELDFSDMDWDEVDLSDVDFSDVDFSDVDFSSMDLSALDLSGIDLSGLDFSDLDFSGMDLSGLDFSQMDLSGLDLSTLDLSGIDLSGALSAGDLSQLMPALSPEDIASLLGAVELKVTTEELQEMFGTLLRSFLDYAARDPATDFSRLGDAAGEFLGSQVFRDTLEAEVQAIVAEISQQAITTEELQELFASVIEDYPAWAAENELDTEAQPYAYIRDYLASPTGQEKLGAAASALQGRLSELGVNEEQRDRLLGAVYAAYQSYAAENNLPDPSRLMDTFSAYAATPEAQALIGAGLEKAIDTTKLQEQVSAMMASYTKTMGAQVGALLEKSMGAIMEQLGQQLTEQLGAAMAGQMSQISGTMEKAMTDVMTRAGETIMTRITTTLMEDAVPAIMETLGSAVMEKISDALSGEVMEKIGTALSENLSEGLKEQMENIGEQLKEKFSEGFDLDPDALAEAFSMNMGEGELQDLMMSLMSTDAASPEGNLRKLNYADPANPATITIYPTDFAGKARVKQILDDYNARMQDRGEEEKVIVYTDVVDTLMSSVTDIVDAISYVLIAFVAISLVVSSIMIGVITYISVLERNKEIGILRAIGASKRNISQVFNAETFIIGALAGLFGVGITWVLLFPANALIRHLTDQENIRAVLPFGAAVALVGLSIILTLIGGIIPSRKAARSDPVTALRSE